MVAYEFFATMCWLLCIAVWLPPRVVSRLADSWVGRAWDAIRDGVEWVLVKIRVVR